MLVLLPQHLLLLHTASTMCHKQKCTTPHIASTDAYGTESLSQHKQRLQEHQEACRLPSTSHTITSGITVYYTAVDYATPDMPGQTAQSMLLADSMMGPVQYL